MTDKVQKIREELARLKEETSIGLSEHENGVEQGRMEIINALSLFLDSLQEDPEYLDSSSCELWSDEQTRRNLINFLKSLGATEIPQASYNRYLSYLEKQGEQKSAKWQKEQDKQWLDEEYKHIFAKGMDSMKQQMMKEAADAKITLLDGISYVSKDILSKFKPGDKVKVIVIKED